MGRVVGCFELDGWLVAAVAVEAFVVEPVHPGEGGEFEVADVVPGSWGVRAVDALGLTVFAQGVVAVGDGPDRRACPDLVETFP